MKLLTGLTLFLLCALAGEGRARRLQRREQRLSCLYGLIREIGERQLTELVSFQEAALRCAASPERELLLRLVTDTKTDIPWLTSEETDCLAAYARSESRTVSALRAEQEALLSRLQRERDATREERSSRGQVYRSVGYLFGVAVLLLVL